MKSDNQTLKENLKALQDKHEKANLKYSTL